jgi:hypothetical protein
MTAIMPAAAMPVAISNVVALRPRLCDAHRALLAAWVKAGRRMGLHDAAIVHRTPEGAAEPTGMAVIWVRENPDPAYLVRFEGVGWAVLDTVRGAVLGRFESFAQALEFIRPVLGAAQRRRPAASVAQLR